MADVAEWDSLLIDFGKITFLGTELAARAWLSTDFTFDERTGAIRLVGHRRAVFFCRLSLTSTVPRPCSGRAHLAFTLSEAGIHGLPPPPGA